VLFEEAVQPIQHHAGLGSDRPALGVEVSPASEVLTAVDHQGPADSLSRLRGAGAPRENGNVFVGGDLNDADDVLLASRNDHPDGLDLIDRCIGAVPAPAEGVEEHLAFQLVAKFSREARVADAGGRWGH
jgi:hypothetical protein